MAKFCSKCGNELEENVKFCNQCGATVEVKKVESVTDTPTQKRGNGLDKKAIGVVLALVVVIGIIVAIANGNKPYEKPLQYFVEGVNSGDYEMFCKAVLPSELKTEWAYMVKEEFDEMVSDASENGGIELVVKKSKKEVKGGMEEAILTVDGGFKNHKVKDMEISVIKIGDNWYLVNYKLDFR